VSAPLAAAPSGVVTFLFTDIEGSTRRRWEADVDEMRSALATHDEVLRVAVETHGGWLFKHTGDGVCAAFLGGMGEIGDTVDAIVYLENASFVVGKSCTSMAARAPGTDPDRAVTKPLSAQPICSQEGPTMEYFVEMTTHVPQGTPEDTVDDIRAREAARSRELAAEGHLLRLWRPPLAPGEWRTFGLFSADGDRQLDTILASMPLHVWRTDEVTPLSEHPNDPGSAQGREPVEFLTALTLTVPEGTPVQTVDEMKTQEAMRAHELADEGRLVRLWTPPDQLGQWRTLGLWSARDEAELKASLESLPLYVWMTVETTRLTPHPNDPVGGTRS
jgi:muconolactone delta-isomerase